MNNVHAVAMSNNRDDGTDERSGILLRVVSTLNNSIEKLTTSAEIHDKMDVLLVLKGITKIGDIRVTLQVMHDLNFTLDIFNILCAGELALGNRLASIGRFLFFGLGETSSTELAAAKHLAKIIIRGDLL
jgi:hypothetical protein